MFTCSKLYKVKKSQRKPVSIYGCHVPEYVNCLELRIHSPTESILWDPRLVYENKFTPYCVQTNYYY